MIHVFTCIIVFLTLTERITSQDCSPLVTCIRGYGAVFSIAELPDFSNYKSLVYRAFLQALCGNLVPYSKCQQFDSAAVGKCPLLGEFEGKITATIEQKKSLAEAQCLHLNGMVEFKTCLLGNTTVEQAVDSCTSTLESDLQSKTDTVCSLVSVWKLCVQGHIQDICPVSAVDYQTNVTQKYVTELCSNKRSVATRSICNVFTFTFVLTFSSIYVHMLGNI